VIGERPFFTHGAEKMKQTKAGNPVKGIPGREMELRSEMQSAAVKYGSHRCGKNAVYHTSDRRLQYG